MQYFFFNPSFLGKEEFNGHERQQNSFKDLQWKNIM